MFLCVWVEFCRLHLWPLRCFVWPAWGSLKFECGVLASLHFLVYQISHLSLLSLAQPVHPLALTLYPSRYLDLRPLLQTFRLLELPVVWYKKLPQMRVPPFFFFFSVSASNRVIHMSNCSLPLCFVYQTSYGMKRKVRDCWDLFWKKLWRGRCQTGTASAAPKSWVEAPLIGP